MVPRKVVPREDYQVAVIFLAIFELLFIAMAVALVLSEQSKEDTQKEPDYLVLVNKQHKLPDDWYKTVDLVPATNVTGGDFTVERKALEQFYALRRKMLEEGVQIELDSVTRTPEEQQIVWDNYAKDKGEDYCKKYIAPPGFSEHHTGLAIDICLVKDGKVINDNDEMIAERETFEKVWAHLAEFGFILRYLEGKDDITGYAYEPWHFRYINDPEAAKEIMQKGLTFEEYLGKVEK